MNQIKFHWFDMDHTLIDNDCDVSWKEFLVRHHLAPDNSLDIANGFFADYNQGELNHADFMKFQLAEFTGRKQSEMDKLALMHFEEYVLPTIYPAAAEYIGKLRKENCNIGILTATNTTLARPVALYFKADILLGTELEKMNDLFTGNFLPPYAGSEGKAEIMRKFSCQTKITAQDIAYYGDSINDRFVMEMVGHPFAVNPSRALLTLATEKNWPVINFK